MKMFCEGVCGWSPAGTWHWSNVGLTWVQRRRRWTNFKPTLIPLVVSAGSHPEPDASLTIPDVYPVLGSYWASVTDGGTTLFEYWMNFSWFMGSLSGISCIYPANTTHVESVLVWLCQNLTSMDVRWPCQNLPSMDIIFWHVYSR